MKTADIKNITIGNRTISKMEIWTSSTTKREVALTCKITYNGNGNTSGSVPSPTEGHYGESVTLATNSGNLVKTNYDFIGWNTAQDGSGTTYVPGGSYTLNGNITLYACWLVQWEVTFCSNITFNNEYYWINGQSGTAALVGNKKQRVSQGSPIGSFPSGYGTSSSGLDYSLSGVTYSIYVESWNTIADGTGTTVKTTDVPTGHVTYYAKWKIAITTYTNHDGTSVTEATKEIIKQDAAGGLTIVLPKFVKRMYSYCIGGGGGSEYFGSDVDDDQCEIGIGSEGSWGSTVTNNTYSGGTIGTENMSGGETIYLYAGAAAEASYININGNRLITGNAGTSGGSISRRYNVYDVDSGMEKKILDSKYQSRPGILSQTANKGSTNMVSDYSIRGSVRFQFYRFSGNASSGVMYLRVSTNGGSSWNAYNQKIGSYNYDDEASTVSWISKWGWIRNSFTQGSWHAYTPSVYGQPGSGFYAISRGTSYKPGQQAGFRGRAYIFVSS